MGLLIMIVALKRKKRKSAQYRYLEENRPQILEWTGAEHFPSRATYFRRYRRARQLYRTAIYCLLRNQCIALIGVGRAD
jgi:hypothetical protein